MRKAAGWVLGSVGWLLSMQACGDESSSGSGSPVVPGGDASYDGPVLGDQDASSGGYEASVEAAPPPDAASDVVVSMTCGDGMTTGAEQCDLGAENGKPGSCCSATCTFVAAGTECRAATGACDAAERCTGASAACPTDAPAADGAACADQGGATCCGGKCSVTAAAGTCDVCAVAAHGPQRVTIIESSSMGGQNMDQRWQAVATAAGHTATIAPQTTLDALANLANTDILVVSSGTITLSATAQGVIDAFAASKRGVYLQGEYLSTFASNQTFSQIVAAHGGTFTWGQTLSDFQDPVAIGGCLATTPEPAASVTKYWYACTGAGVAPKLAVAYTAAGGQPIGWTFCLPGGGLVVHNTDQDFVNSSEGDTPKHMKNVLVRLADAASCK